MNTAELKKELKARFITARDNGQPATIGITEVLQMLESLERLDRLGLALDLILEDLTEYNAHTLAAMLEGHYRGTDNEEALIRAYKAAQWELTGTR